MSECVCVCVCVLRVFAHNHACCVHVSVQGVERVCVPTCDGVCLYQVTMCVHCVFACVCVHV